MGLCKCPKKKITNQFCFEHRVNVCEHCMVAEHPTCVVQSYLKWLDDSDYNPVCRICNDTLGTTECIRLVCYDVFHKDCLNDWATRLPPNTAPAGYKCPVCSSPVFPASNLVSPVADCLREMISTYAWARTGLGLPLIQETHSEAPAPQDWSSANGSVGYETVSETETSEASTHTRVVTTAAVETFTYAAESYSRPHVQGHNESSSVSGGVSSSSASNSVRVTAIEDPPIAPSQFRGDSHHSTASSVARKPSSSSDETHLLLSSPDADEQENKYKRRSAVEWFGRWWRTMSRPSSRHHQRILRGNRRMVLILLVLAGVSLIVVLSYFSHGASDDDPLLDPFNNPNIRVEGE